MEDYFVSFFKSGECKPFCLHRDHDRGQSVVGLSCSDLAGRNCLMPVSWLISMVMSGALSSPSLIW